MKKDSEDLRSGGEERVSGTFVNDREAALARRVYRRQEKVEDPYSMNKAIEAVVRVRLESGDPTKTCDHCEHHVDLHYPHPKDGEPCCDADFGSNYFTPKVAPGTPSTETDAPGEDFVRRAVHGDVKGATANTDADPDEGSGEDECTCRPVDGSSEWDGHIHPDPECPLHGLRSRPEPTSNENATERNLRDGADEGSGEGEVPCWIYCNECEHKQRWYSSDPKFCSDCGSHSVTISTLRSRPEPTVEGERVEAAGRIVLDLVSELPITADDEDFGCELLDRLAEIGVTRPAVHEPTREGEDGD